MAKIAAKVANIAIGAVALEGYADSIALNVDQELPVVTSISDAGPRVVTGNYNYGVELSGKADFASGAVDATLFALVGDADGAALAFDPTGTTAGANDPNYDSTQVQLASYKISAAVGGAVEYSASLVGGAALTRAVA